MRRSGGLSQRCPRNFYDAYRAVAQEAVPRWVADAKSEADLLNLFLLEKAAHEICFEAANRPSWLGIPLRGFAGIAARLLHATEMETV